MDKNITEPKVNPFKVTSCFPPYEREEIPRKYIDWEGITPVGIDREGIEKITVLPKGKCAIEEYFKDNPEEKVVFMSCKCPKCSVVI